MGWDSDSWAERAESTYQLPGYPNKYAGRNILIDAITRDEPIVA